MAEKIRIVGFGSIFTIGRRGRPVEIAIRMVKWYIILYNVLSVTALLGSLTMPLSRYDVAMIFSQSSGHSAKYSKDDDCRIRHHLCRSLQP